LKPIETGAHSADKRLDASKAVFKVQDLWGLVGHWCFPPIDPSKVPNMRPLVGWH
jgi:hypothetical protein